MASLFAASLVVYGAEKAADADNTGRNERDRTGETKTPIDQSESPEDLKITQAIRQALVGDDSLSMNAKNVKIITANGAVTLRGPVNSEEERQKIAKHAKSAAGSAKINNLLEIEAGDKPNNNQKQKGH
jgi:hyperosmotically inducible periplasmic protein